MSNSRQQTAVLTADNQINNVPMAKIKSGCAAQQRGGGLFKKSFVETDAFISGTVVVAITLVTVGISTGPVTSTVPDNSDFL